MTDRQVRFTVTEQGTAFVLRVQHAQPGDTFHASYENGGWIVTATTDGVIYGRAPLDHPFDPSKPYPRHEEEP